jgi:hypothetical protein
MHMEGVPKIKLCTGFARSMDILSNTTNEGLSLSYNPVIKTFPNACGIK